MHVRKRERRCGDVCRGDCDRDAAQFVRDCERGFIGQIIARDERRTAGKRPFPHERRHGPSFRGGSRSDFHDESTRLAFELPRQAVDGPFDGRADLGSDFRTLPEMEGERVSLVFEQRARMPVGNSSQGSSQELQLNAGWKCRSMILAQGGSTFEAVQTGHGQLQRRQQPVDLCDRSPTDDGDRTVEKSMQAAQSGQKALRYRYAGGRFRDIE